MKTKMISAGTIFLSGFLVLFLCLGSVCNAGETTTSIPPYIESIYPNSIGYSDTPQQQLDIYGRDLFVADSTLKRPKVEFKDANGNVATTDIFWIYSGKRIKCTAPVLAIGSYTVKVVTQEGDSNEVDLIVTNAIPAKPSNPKAVALSSASQPTIYINLNWKNNSSNETGFRISRNVDNGSFEPLATVGANITTYSDSTFITGKHIYSYIVCAANSMGSSAYTDPSPEITVDPAKFPPVFANSDYYAAPLNAPLSLKIEAPDLDTPGSSLIYSAANLPPDANFDSATQMFTWTPSASTQGRYDVVFTVSDGYYTVNKTITMVTIRMDQFLFDAGLGNNLRNIRVSGDKVVWSDGKVYMYDMTNKTIKMLCPGEQNDTQLYADIYGDRVVWSGTYGGVTQLYMYTISTGMVTQLTSINAERCALNLYGDNIVYTCYYNTGERGIYMWNIPTSQETRIGSGHIGQDSPSIYGDKIIWVDNPASPNDKLYMYDISTKQETLISEKLVLGPPCIYGDRIVWQAGNTVTMLYETYMYEISTGKKSLLFATGNFPGYPRISKDMIVFTYRLRASGSKIEIHAYNLSTKQEIQIDTGSAYNPDIDGNEIVYLKGNPYDINMVQLIEAPQVTSALPAAIPTRSTITINGSDFGLAQTDQKVLFPNGVIVKDLSSFASDKITCVVPDNAQSGPLKVQAMDMDSNSVDINIMNVYDLTVTNGTGSGVYEKGTVVNIVAANPPEGYKFDCWTGDTSNITDIHNSSTTITMTANAAVAAKFRADMPPVLDPIGNKTVKVRTTLSFTIKATDPDGDTLTYAAQNLPWGASFTASTKTFSWTPTDKQVGIYNVTFSVSDGSLTDSEKITINVTNINHPPVLDHIGNKSIDENKLLTFTISATDPDGDILRYTALGLPRGATFNPYTRTFSWKPSYTQAGIYPNVVFIVSDGRLTDFERITITVNNVNQPPVLNPIGNKTVNENQLLQFTISASDTDPGDILVYTASNLPTGASFDAAKRKFTWTPTYEQAGIYKDVTFKVTDREGLSDSEAITITVNNIPRIPVISAITPAQGSVGTIVTITGSNFLDAAGRVTLSGNGVTQPATIQKWTNKQILCRIPQIPKKDLYTLTVASKEGNSRGVLFSYK